MTRGANECLAHGARLLARRKAVVVWVFLAYFGFAIGAMSVASATFAPVTNTSLYSQRLAGGFDLVAMFELLGRPEISLGPLAVRSIVAIIGLGLLLWFCTAGIAAEFLSPENLGRERFFQTCGAFWWRFVRLILLTWVILLPTIAILGGIRTGLVDAADKSWHVRLPFIVFVAVSIIMQLIVLILRGWFDTAEFELIHNNRSKVRRALGEARRLTRGHRLQILWIYLVPAVLMWVVAFVWVALWLAAPAKAVGLAFLLAQAIILTLIVGRMWERAAQATWYLDHAPVPVEMPAIEPAIIEPIPSEPEPPGDFPQPEVDLP
jgi:hypothetical protein